MPEEKTNLYLVPGAIVIAGLLVAVAVYYTRGPSVSTKTPTASSAATQNASDVIKPITADDHLLGNPNAPVKMIEFSDTECPFCKRFHPTLEQIMAEYGKSGQVAWVYRHFPLDQLHPKARKEAEATECAAEVGGSDKFWTYLNKIFEVTPSNNGLDPAILPKLARDMGIDGAKFDACLASGKYASRVESNYQDAVAAGGTGTPYLVVIAANGQKFSITGAQPYGAVKQVIDQALAAK